jgi:hypothetical protein
MSPKGVFCLIVLKMVLLMRMLYLNIIYVVHSYLFLLPSSNVTLFVKYEPMRLLVQPTSLLVTFGTTIVF